MKVINVSKKAFKQLDRMELPSEVMNSESKVYYFDHHGIKKVLKNLNKTNGEYHAMKLYTVEMLDNFRENLPNSFVIPDAFVTCGGENIGFTMPLIKGTPLTCLLKDNNLDINVQLELLRQVGNILKRLEYVRKYTPLNNIYINDLHDSNFIVNMQNREMNVIDLDSVKIGENKIFLSRYLNPFGLVTAFPNKYKVNDKSVMTDEIPYTYEEYYELHNFPEGYIIPDENTDLYCYGIMILNYLFQKNISNSTVAEFYNYINYLNDIGVNSELVDCLARIVSPIDNTNPVYYIDEITEKHIERIRKDLHK